MNAIPPALKPFTSKTQPALKWAVWFSESGKRRRKAFRTKREATDFHNRKKVEFQNLGNELASNLTDDLKREAVECKRRLEPYGAKLSDAVDLFVLHAEASAKSKPVAELVTEFLEHAKAQGKRTATVAELRFRLNKFVHDFGDRLVSDMTGRDVSQWLHRIKGGMQSKNNFRRTCSTFFNWCRGQGFVRENPVAGLRPFKVERGPVAILTPPEMTMLLREVDGFGSDVKAFLLIGGFGGLRSVEIERLAWEQVKLERGFIDLSATTTKTAQRRLVEIREPLATWLREEYAFETGPLRKANFKRRLLAFRRHLKKQHDFYWPDNCLRHSFASYLLAAIGDAWKVAEQLGHSSPTMVYRHYRELVEPETALSWWSLGPKKVDQSIVSMVG